MSETVKGGYQPIYFGSFDFELGIDYQMFISNIYIEYLYRIFISNIYIEYLYRIFISNSDIEYLNRIFI